MLLMLLRSKPVPKANPSNQSRLLEFSINCRWWVPDLLDRRDMAEYGGADLVTRGLRVEELTSAELTVAQAIRAARPKLSLPDAYAYSLASSRQWGLLNGDGELRALAQAAQIPLFGLLWVTDQLSDSQIVEAAVIVAGLEAIAAHPMCRLPSAEIQLRLARYHIG
jgi:hypothetical protein